MHRSIERCFIFIGCVDFYIRMHTAYYNKDGILVTHPLYTSLNYIRTSFLMDLLCIFPFSELRLHHMFGMNYRYHVLLFMANSTRPWMFYRIFNGITYLEDRSKEGRAILFHILKYVLLVSVILGVLASFLLLLSCLEETETSVVVCSNDSWLEDHTVLKDIQSYTNTIISYYIVLSIYTSCVVSLYIFKTKEEIVFMITMAFILFAVRWFVLAKITSSRVSFNYIFSNED